MAPLYNIVPDPENYHIRMCGGETARDQLLAGLAQDGKKVQSFRAEECVVIPEAWRTTDHLLLDFPLLRW
ncbi:MAG: hypothetical protein A2945_01275 [Candidatus Liptonbacteria bacterium RIFCSPLOWO2_01_FULL_52_25]|uniref:Uncharacterized protein n=1 Tax=Candidatus Liptonbacteria bacterium RIFCSPLOWO2_01_FULL_52_25 TaxID=1798650 RepID=A0A1G2CE41_9BACT|nr:MAG: hypothetical protein A2945_01275 [Candidatus Liptonbacteria bacterium RIFCSPLOWO2_01_FULL_52_25]